ncbi:AMP-binding protein [Yinghuangia aomiensis]
MALVFRPGAADAVTWTYRELNARANRIARLLAAHGAGTRAGGRPRTPPTPDMVAALFAVLKTGAAYLPLELDLPAQRLGAAPRTTAHPSACSPAHSAARDVPEHPTAARVLIDAPATAERLLRLSDADPTDDERPGFTRAEAHRMDHPAYIIYTSGTTGRPKGVVTPYRGLTNMQYNHRRHIFDPVVREAGRRLRIAHTVSFAFDMSWEELLWLVEGHEVHICDEQLRRDAHALTSYLDTHHVDVVNITPTYAQHLLSGGTVGRRTPAVPSAARRRGRLRTRSGSALRGHAGRPRLQPVRARRNTRSTPSARAPTNPRHPPSDAPSTTPRSTSSTTISGRCPRAPGRAVRRGRRTGPRLPPQPRRRPPRGSSPTRSGLLGTACTAQATSPATAPTAPSTTSAAPTTRPKSAATASNPPKSKPLLTHHAEVTHSAVVPSPGPDGMPRLVAYVVADPEASAGADAAAEQLAEWQQIYDAEYHEIGTALFREDFAGWDSSYDGLPIPVEHMREWRDATVARIAGLAPCRRDQAAAHPGDRRRHRAAARPSPRRIARRTGPPISPRR